jgi:hypothetical protein
MKQAITLLSGAAALIALGAGLWFSQTTAQAQCTPAGTNDPQNITCTGPAGPFYSYDAVGGDDTISISGDFNNSTIRGGADNDSISNSGDFNGSYIVGGDGNDSISNSGAFSNVSVIFGVGGNDSISNSGAFSNNSQIQGNAGNDSLSNSGNFNGSYIFSGDGNDSISNSGDFSNVSSIFGDAGNDTITLLPGSAFDASSWVDGDYLNFTTGYSDLLILYVETPVNFDTKFPLCHGQANAAAMQAAGCFVPWEGGVLYFTNFEKIQVILLQVLAAQGISVDIPAGPQVICDDGRVKVFKLPNGDVEYYSGFDLLAPNGFMVARVSLLDLANGVRTFPTAAQTPNPLGWRVVITQTGNALSGQVVDADGNAVGGSCKH